MLDRQVVEEFPELDNFLTVFARNMSLAKRKNIITDEFLLTTDYNYESVAHSRIWGLIAKTGYDLDYVVEIGSGFKPGKGRQFRPDVQLWKSDELMFLIEYESTNSSDSRIIWKCLRLYRESLGKELDNFPKYWLIIYTLPECWVSRWYSWDYSKRDWVYEEMTQNPHQFYKRGLLNPADLNIAEYPSISELTEGEGWLSHKLFLVNLTIDGLEIDFPEKFGKKYLFK